MPDGMNPYQGSSTFTSVVYLRLTLYFPSYGKHIFLHVVVITHNLRDKLLSKWRKYHYAAIVCNSLQLKFPAIIFTLSVFIKRSKLQHTRT